MFKMSKLNRLGAVLLLVALVGVAWGAVSKIPSFVVEQNFQDCFSTATGSLNYPIADGMAILNYVPGTDRTIVQVILSDFTPGPLVINDLIVSLEHAGGHDDLGTVRIGAQGNGHFHGEISGDFRGANVTLWQEVDPPFPPANCPPVLVGTGQGS